MLALTVLTIGLNVYLFVIVPKGFFPQQDTGRLTGGSRVRRRTPRFRRCRGSWQQIVGIVKHDPAVDNVVGFTGGGGGGTAANSAACSSR